MSELKLTIYTTNGCPNCERAKHMLDDWGVGYREVRIDGNRSGLVEMARVARGARTVPQFAVGGLWIGGISELTQLYKTRGPAGLGADDSVDTVSE